MPAPKTHFEQIPVETVLKIATELVQSNAGEHDCRDTQTPGQVTPGGYDWRELAQRVQEEPDSTKMMGMVEELIAKLDEADLRKRRLLARDHPNGSSSSGA